MTYPKRFSIVATIILPIVFAFSLLATAQTTANNQTLGSAEDVYRIEVRNLDSLLVMTTGDGAEQGELHSVTVRLEAGDQFDMHSTESRYLMTHQGTRGGTGYLSINPNDKVVLSGGAHDHDLWIHISNKRFEFSPTATVTITTRELDCVRQRVCDRGGTAKFELTFELPEFTNPPPTSCGDANTYALTHVNGTVDADGLNTWTKSMTGPYGGTTSIAAQGKHEAAILHPIEAEICIASTRNSAARPAPLRQPTGPMIYVQNVASGKCLVPSRGGTSSELDLRLAVEECQFSRSGGTPEQQKWHLDEVGSGTYRIRHSLLDYCANVRASSQNRDGGRVDMVECGNHVDQQWRQTNEAPGQIRLRSQSTGRCLNLHGREHRDGGTTSVYRCADTEDQNWMIVSERAARSR
ncbi:MAG: RICIN domain-containing protein [Pseudomonadota bacterium]